MKKFLVFVLGIVLLAMPSMYSQTLPPWTEDFDGTVTFTAIPTGSWISDAVYHLPGSSTSSPKSILGLVPTLPGNTAILETPPYDCTNYDYVLLRFSHICKVSPYDTVRIEYRTNAGGGMGRWNPLPLTAYMGNSLFAYNGQFNASTYPEWQGNDNTVFPSQSWWKEEMFDLASIANRTSIQFRFVITHGQKDGTHASYGWLIDNFKLLASTHQLYPPYIEFISPLVKDTVYSTGPWEINAKVRTSTNGLIQTPWLKYTNIENGIATTMDSVLMTPVEGDTLWKGIIPQFVEGTEVQYTITAQDIFGNYGTKTSSYIIKKGISGEWIIGTGTETTLYTPYYTNYRIGWSRTIYYDWEINPQGIGGRITSIAYNNANSESTTTNKLSIYFKPTLETTFPQLIYVEPENDPEATLVWGQSSHTTSQGWNVFNFQTPYDLPPGYNLMVYWKNEYGNYADAGHHAEWYYTQQSVNNNIRAYSDTDPDLPSISSVVYDRRRPNIKLAMQATNFLDNSVSLASIDTKDTIVVAPLVDVPIIASVINRGNLNLDSVILHYDINGAIQGQKKVYPKTLAPWDFIVQDTIVEYTPKKNGWDTITVWVSLPNGKYDSVSIDDTLTKIIYGSTDVSMAFVMSPTDTVYYTGPYNING
ncbi:MAG: hypothetical protein LBG80_16720 [Bacteroidales bacterium]|jgi:hypothetical protein|nr:hypothetical protein [Bacteroidales bacterium]